jgi:hypothetical protein
MAELIGAPESVVGLTEPDEHQHAPQDSPRDAPAVMSPQHADAAPQSPAAGPPTSPPPPPAPAAAAAETKPSKLPSRRCFPSDPLASTGSAAGLAKMRAARPAHAAGALVGGSSKGPAAATPATNSSVSNTIAMAREALAHAKSQAGSLSGATAAATTSSAGGRAVDGAISDKPFTLYGKVDLPPPKAPPQISSPNADEAARRRCVRAPGAGACLRPGLVQGRRLQRVRWAVSPMRTLWSPSLRLCPLTRAGPGWLTRRRCGSAAWRRRRRPRPVRRRQRRQQRRLAPRSTASGWRSAAPNT